MRTRSARIVLVLPVIAVLSACGAAGGMPLSGGTGPTGSSSAPTSSAAGPRSSAANAPPPEAAMTCGPEVERRLKTLLDRATVPAGESTWRNNVFTCTYRLPEGPLVLTVTVLADGAAAKARFEREKVGRAGAKPIKGLASLGLPSYQSPSGVVGFAKDNFAFSSDASSMTARVGPDGRSRNDFAYGVAATVLACWSE